MRSKTAVAALFFGLVCIAPRAMFADSIKLTATNGVVFPYTFTVTQGSTVTTGVPLVCLDDDRSVFVGESWNVAIVNLNTLIAAGKAVDSTLPAATDIADLKADAYLDSLFNTGAGTDTEIQNAIWDVFNPGTKFLDSKAQNLENNALKIIAGTMTEPSAFYSQFTFYYPSGGNGSTSEPQDFLGYAQITPEPTSLVLLGTGIVGLAGVMRRRLKSTPDRS